MLKKRKSTVEITGRDVTEPVRTEDIEEVIRKLRNSKFSPVEIQDALKYLKLC